MINFRIGGVPEHFNFPWIYGLKHKTIGSQNYAINFSFQNGGTGEMVERLENQDLDLAIMLTEGAIYSINKGSNFKILQEYVETPLLWGIHVDANSNYKTIDDLEGTTTAISRYGSGSHLMAAVNAHQRNWNLDQLKFKVCDHINGAVKSLKDQTSDYIMWERFTTKPLVDQGLLRHLGDCPTPWPCFVLVCREEIYDTHKAKIEEIQHQLKNTLSILHQTEDLNQLIAHEFELQPKDVKHWLKVTKWSTNNLEEKEIKLIQNRLKDLNLLDDAKNSKKFNFV